MDDDVSPGLWPGSLPEEDRVARLICEVLDPVLVPHGFAPGQPGVSPGSAGAVFCAAEQHVRSFLPGLVEPDAPDQDRGCTDVNVHATTGPRGRLTDVDVDGADLPDLLLRLHRPGHAARAERLSSLPLPDGLPELADLLGVLLDAAADPTARRPR